MAGRPRRNSTSPPPLNQAEGLRLTQRQLLQAARAASIGVIASDLAHEIGNPLFAIQGISEVLLKNPDRHLASDSAKTHVRLMFESAQRASTLIHDMLGFMKYSNTPEELQLREVVEGALAVVARGFPAEVQVRCRFEQAPPVLGFSDRLQLLFVNLLLDALVALQAGTVEVRVWSSKGQVKVRVKCLGQRRAPTTGDDTELRASARASAAFVLAVCTRIVKFHEGELATPSDGETVVAFPFNNLSSMRPNPSPEA